MVVAGVKNNRIVDYIINTTPSPLSFFIPRFFFSFFFFFLILFRYFSILSRLYQTGTEKKKKKEEIRLPFYTVNGVNSTGETLCLSLLILSKRLLNEIISYQWNRKGWIYF